MKFQSFEKTERRVLTVAFILLLLSSALLWQDEWIYRVIQKRKIDVEQIGSVKILKNDVRRRHEVALSWLPLRNENQIYQGDSIFTGDGSTVIIRTTEGEE